MAAFKQFITDLLTFPDKSNGWIPYAIGAGGRIIKDWQPDIIFATGPPFSAFIVGAALQRRSGAKLVCEFRDRWWDDPYYPPSRPIQLLRRWCEERIVRRAAAITTVSEPWAETYRARYGKPVRVIYNGYDTDVAEADCAVPFEADQLEIVYTGGIYPGRRDPSPLFAALAADARLRQAVRVWFYGTKPQHVEPLAAHYGVSDNIRVMPPVPHGEAVTLQRRADVLLLMQWNDPREQGNVPGKFFEYLGSGRPILLIGLEGGVPDRILSARQAGWICNTPEAMQHRLRALQDEKLQTGSVAPVPEGAAAGYSRAEQFDTFIALVRELTKDPQPT